MEDNSVFQPWLTTISWKMQTVIVTGLRGCDGLTKFDPSKHISRSIRMAALKNADTTTTYMKHDLFEELLEANKKFVADLDRYPVHFVLHMMHACEILGYKHPDQHTRDVFSAVYNQIVWGMHLRPEPEADMDHRLADKRESQARQDVEPSDGGAGGIIQGWKDFVEHELRRHSQHIALVGDAARLAAQ